MAAAKVVVRQLVIIVVLDAVKVVVKAAVEVIHIIIWIGNFQYQILSINY